MNICQINETARWYITVSIYVSMSLFSIPIDTSMCVICSTSSESTQRTNHPLPMMILCAGCSTWHPSASWSTGTPGSRTGTWCSASWWLCSATRRPSEPLCLVFHGNRAGIYAANANGANTSQPAGEAVFLGGPRQPTAQLFQWYSWLCRNTLIQNSMPGLNGWALLVFPECSPIRRHPPDWQSPSPCFFILPASGIAVFARYKSFLDYFISRSGKKPLIAFIHQIDTGTGRNMKLSGVDVKYIFHTSRL